jgi:hypothetical protein
VSDYDDAWKAGRLAELDAIDRQIDDLPEFIGDIHKRHSAMIRSWINEGWHADGRLQSELRRWAAELERIPVERGQGT